MSALAFIRRLWKTKIVRRTEQWHDNHTEKTVMGNCQRKLRLRADGDEGGQERAGIQRSCYHEEWQGRKRQTKKTTAYLLCKHKMSMSPTIRPLVTKCISLNTLKQQTFKSNQAAGMHRQRVRGSGAGRREGGSRAGWGHGGEASSPRSAFCARSPDFVTSPHTSPEPQRKETGIGHPHATRPRGSLPPAPGQGPS